MPIKTAHLYRIPLLLSITLTIVLIALRVENDILNLIVLAIGTLLGTFVLDLDYIIHAYFVDPEAQFSKMVISYIKHKDINGLLTFINVHKNDIEDKTLNSALFQVVLGGAALFVISSEAGIFVKALVLSTFLNSIYRFMESFMEGRTTQWFWSLKIKQGKVSMYGYGFILLVTFFYTLILF